MKDEISFEFVGILVFFGMYFILRLLETYIIPIIPTFITKEIFNLVKWYPILIPIIYGITYLSKKDKKKIINDNNILRERMMLWIKK